jgi:hypothetical protein
MKVRLSAHARDMLRLRGIDLKWVMETLEAPSQSAQDPRDPALTRSFRTIHAAGNRSLRVVHRSDEDEIVIVTAHSIVERDDDLDPI